MGYLVGIMLALVVGIFASAVGFDKERSFYPVVLIVVASYYVLFASMAGIASSVFMETLPTLLFVAAAALGFKKTPWIVVGGLAIHGIFDLIHHRIITNPGVPDWWPAFCPAFDITAALYLGVLLLRRRREVRNAVA